eukprot:scaffold38198_cov16-Prasinocladus_malaysianus.AAC.1
MPSLRCLSATNSAEQMPFMLVKRIGEDIVARRSETNVNNAIKQLACSRKAHQCQFKLPTLAPGGGVVRGGGR